MEDRKKLLHKVILLFNAEEKYVKRLRLLAVALHQHYRKVLNGTLDPEAKGRRYFRLNHDGKWYGAYLDDRGHFHVEDRKAPCNIIWSLPLCEAMHLLKTEAGLSRQREVML
jgi:hypothetical protein